MGFKIKIRSIVDLKQFKYLNKIHILNNLL